VLLMLAFLLRRRGWDVVYLGANVPLSRLDAAMQLILPRLILSVAQTLNSAATLQEMADYVNHQGIFLAYGGGIFNQIPDLQKHISGYFLGEDVASAPRVIEQLLGQLPPLQVLQPVLPEYRQVLEKFVAHQALIAAAVTDEMLSLGLNPAHLEEANANFPRLIISALSLGDINYLDESVGWLEGLLENYALSPALAVAYFKAYRRTAQRYLGNQGGPVLDWLAKVDQAE
jgi:hypothetical protein